MAVWAGMSKLRNRILSHFIYPITTTIHPQYFHWRKEINYQAYVAKWYHNSLYTIGNLCIVLLASVYAKLLIIALIAVMQTLENCALKAIQSSPAPLFSLPSQGLFISLVVVCSRYKPPALLFSGG